MDAIRLKTTTYKQQNLSHMFEVFLYQGAAINAGGVQQDGKRCNTDALSTRMQALLETICIYTWELV